MRKSFIFLAILTFFNSNTMAMKKKLILDINLSPAGSFKIESSKIKGKVYINNKNEVFAKNIRVPIKNLKTGIELRDDHLKNKLGYNSNKKEKLLLKEAKGTNGSGKAKFIVLGRSQTVDFTYKILGKSYIEAYFSLSLQKFGISGIQYMGVGVEDIVKAKVTLPLKEKK